MMHSSPIPAVETSGPAEARKGLRARTGSVIELDAIWADRIPRAFRLTAALLRNEAATADVTKTRGLPPAERAGTVDVARQVLNGAFQEVG